jgi:hypothetical protein
MMMDAPASSNTSSNMFSHVPNVVKLWELVNPDFSHGSSLEEGILEFMRDANNVHAIDRKTKQPCRQVGC